MAAISQSQRRGTARSYVRQSDSMSVSQCCASSRDSKPKIFEQLCKRHSRTRYIAGRANRANQTTISQPTTADATAISLPAYLPTTYCSSTGTCLAALHISAVEVAVCSFTQPPPAAKAAAAPGFSVPPPSCQPIRGLVEAVSPVAAVQPSVGYLGRSTL